MRYEKHIYINIKGSGVICLSEDEDDESINQLLNKLNIENPTSKTIEACQLLLHQLDERLRNEETIEILLAQMKHTQKRIPPMTGSTNTNVVRQNGHSNQVTNAVNNNSSSTNQTSSSRHQNMDSGIDNSPSNQTDSLAVPGNRTSAQGVSNSGGTSIGNASVGYLNNEVNKSSTAVAATAGSNLTNGPRMTREMAMQALDQQYLARKALLRKQADKALSEVPLARPPQGAMAQSDLNLIPSTATNEFVALVGLEEVVKNLQVPLLFY